MENRATATKYSGTGKEIGEMKVKRKIPNRSRILRKEDEKIPLVEILKRMKRKREAMSSEVCKMRKMTMEEKIPLADFYKMSRKRAKAIEDDDITVLEFYKKIKMRRKPISVNKILMSTPISRKDKEKEIIKISSSSPISKNEEEIVEMSSSSPPPLDKKEESCFLGAGHMSSEEDSDEEKKHIRRSPFVIKGLSDYVNFELLGIKVKEKKPEVESDEELLRECDRNEVDHGYNYVLKKRWRAITNPKNPQITYYKSGIDNHPINHALHDPDYPLATLSKLALRVYNDIQGTQYDYVGLVKAYVRFLGGMCFTIRFKACVLGQDAINFQASIFEGFPDRTTNVVPVRVKSVYPLPPW